MSTNIHNGIRFTDACLLKIHERIMAFRPTLHALQKELMTAWVARRAAHAVDAAALGNPPKDGRSGPLMLAIGEMWDRQKEIKSAGRRDPQVDWEVSFTVIPHAGRVYGTTYIESAELRKALLLQNWIEDFGYWNGSDPPENTSQEDWDARGELWDAILAPDRLSRPGGCGFGVDVICPDAAPGISSVLEAIPPVAERARRLAMDAVIGELLKAERGGFDGTDEEWSTECMSLAFRIADAVRLNRHEAETAAAFGRIIEAIPHVIDGDMLLEPPAGKD